jgi:hypothetical protein
MAISTSGLTVPQVANTVDTSIYSNQNMPKAMTLGDMLDISKKQLELNKAKETYASDVAGAKAASQSLQQKAEQDALQTVKSHVSNITQVNAQLMTDPNLTLDKIAKAYQGVNDMSSGDPIAKAQAYQQTMANAPQQGPNETNDQYQTRLHQFVAYNQTKGLEHLSAMQMAYPSASSVAGVPGFENRLNQTFNPINFNQQGQQNPQAGGNQPGTNAGANQPSAVTPVQNIVKETYPNRANTPYVSDTEKPRFDSGTKLIQEASEIGNSAQNQLNDINNARKYIQAASGTALGQGTRSLAQLVKENPDLDSLIKSTAQLQMNAANRFGASTDAARETAAASAGGANISEKALARILDNAEADLIRDSKYASGLQRFAQKRGAVGGPLNAQDFKQAWSDNAKDRKIYQIMSINSSNKSNADKEMLRDKLLHGYTEAQKVQLGNQIKAMKRLEQGD